MSSGSTTWQRPVYEERPRYLIFNEGYAATAGERWIRPELPSEPEVHGLVALMVLHASRLHARTGPGGEPIPLLEQNRARWGWVLVGCGLAALGRAMSSGGALGPYALQAAIATCHARARVAEKTE